LHEFLMSHAFYMSCLPHHPWFDGWWRVEVTKLAHSVFPACCYSLPLRSKTASSSDLHPLVKWCYLLECELDLRVIWEDGDGSGRGLSTLAWKNKGESHNTTASTEVKSSCLPLCLNTTPRRSIGGVETKLHAFSIEGTAKLHAPAALASGKSYR
jgi:hypothetical protein